MEWKANKGQVNNVIMLAGMAITLFVIVTVLGNLTPSLTTAVGTNTEALASANNATGYVWIAISILAVGILVFAGMSILGFFGVSNRR